MSIYHFRAPTEEDALRDARDTLGDNLKLVRSQRVKNDGMFSFMAKELVEVTVSVGETEDSEMDGQDTEVDPDIYDSSESVDEVYENLIYNMRDLKDVIEQLTNRMVYEKIPAFSMPLGIAFRNMIECGVENTIAKKVIQELILEFKGKELRDKNIVQNELMRVFAETLKRKIIYGKKKNIPKVIAVIGPAGVGKTSMIGKMVINPLFWGKLNTALISCDTFNRASLEQLKSYAAIVDIPMQAAYQPDDIKNARQTFVHKDAIFIDTPGRSPLDHSCIQELGVMLDVAEPDEILLCLPVNMKLDDQISTIERFKYLRPTGIIFTRLDETNNIGMILNVTSYSSIPVTFQSCGNNVPEDITTIPPSELSKAILEPDYFREIRRKKFSSWMNNGFDMDNERIS